MLPMQTQRCIHRTALAFATKAALWQTLPKAGYATEAAKAGCV
jgi:hypothetical protein